MSEAKRTLLQIICLECEARGVFCEMLGGGVPPGHWNPYLISSTYPYSLYYGSTTPGLWSVLHWRVLINRSYLINVTSNALFCIVDVWLDFIYVVVLPLFSRGKNFRTATKASEIIHKTDSSIWYPLTSWIHAHVGLFLFFYIYFQAELLVFVKEHFDFQPAWRSQFQNETNVFIFLVELQLRVLKIDKLWESACFCVFRIS